MADKRLSAIALTNHLRQLAAEVVEVLPDGTQVTRNEKLAELIWKQALGFAEEIKDEWGNTKTVTHKPVSWAQQYLYERIDGKAPIAAPESQSGVRASDRVRDLARNRLNALAEVASGPPAAPAEKKKVKGTDDDIRDRA
jgi:hypothetical protein